MPRSAARATIGGGPVAPPGVEPRASPGVEPLAPPGAEPLARSPPAVAGVGPADDRRRPGIGSEFGVDPVHVVFHGLLGEYKAGGNLPVRVPVRDKGHDLSFARRKAQRARVARHAGGPHLTSAHPTPADMLRGMLPKPAPARARANFARVAKLCAGN